MASSAAIILMMLENNQRRDQSMSIRSRERNLVGVKPLLGGGPT